MTKYQREASDLRFLDHDKRPEDQIARIDKQLHDVLNDGIDLEDNVRGALVEETITTESTKVFHGLGYVPKGFLIVRQEGEGMVWADRVSEWTTEDLYCKSNATSLKVAFFVL
jgi:hypothetical protein